MFQTLSVRGHAKRVGRRGRCGSGVSLALMTMRGETGYLGALSAPVWGFNDVFYRRQEIVLKRDFGEFVMENVVFKPSFPSEIHAQTAIEASFRLHPQVASLDEVHRSRSTPRGARCVRSTKLVL